MASNFEAIASGKRTSNRYSSVTKEKAGGETYTPTLLATFVASQIASTAISDLIGRKIKLLDPAVGDGALLVSLVHHLHELGIENIEVHGYDMNAEALDRASARLSDIVDSSSLVLKQTSFLDVILSQNEQSDFFREKVLNRFDLVIANPPYVRTQILGADTAKRLAEEFHLTGRVDLYYVFLMGIAKVLAPGGVAGIIVSNRFMTIKSGERVRSHIRENFRIEHVWDLGDTKLFDVAVLPSVLLLRHAAQDSSASKFVSIYETKKEAKRQVHSVIEALDYDGVSSLPDGRRFLVQHGWLQEPESPSDVWRIATRESDEWLNTVSANTWGTFRDIGKVRVGVKTTADKVFIRDDWTTLPDSDKPEVLRPLTTHHIARRFRATEDTPKKQILYTHEVTDGRRVAIDLVEHPKAKRYLEKFRERLEGRKYVINAGRRWYEVWVPHDPLAWLKPKLVFRDIAEKPTFWMDFSGSVINGDCYWLISSSERFLWLALAVANSKFSEEFYDQRFHNKLYSGRRRYITQYVEKFPLPDPDSDIASELISLAQKLYKHAPSEQALADEARLNELVYSAFGLSIKKV